MSLRKSAIADPNGNSNTYTWEPGFSYELPHQIPWELFEPLKAKGGKVITFCGGLILIGFVGKEWAEEALREVCYEMGVHL